LIYQILPDICGWFLKSAQTLIPVTGFFGCGYPRGGTIRNTLHI